ncbi:WG repeat-containing protein [Candidatus Saccharibacteria bacterium]|nr:WG repeat-containing protein [Candidatus Saccharibacteria bacterium]
MQGGTGFRKITRAEFDRLTREQQVMYLNRVRQMHILDQQRAQGAGLMQSRSMENVENAQIQAYRARQASMARVQPENNTSPRALPLQRRQPRPQPRFEPEMDEIAPLPIIKQSIKHNIPNDIPQNEPTLQERLAKQLAEQQAQVRSRATDHMEEMQERANLGEEKRQKKAKKRSLASFTNRKTRRGKFSLSNMVATKKRKVMAFAGMLLVLAGVGLFGANLIRDMVLGRSVDRAVWALLDSEKPLAIRQNGRWGYMDVSGRMIIEPQYTSAGEFYGNFAQVNTEATHQIIDRKGDVVLDLDVGASVRVDTQYGVWFIADKMYDVDMKPIGDDRKLGLTYRQRGVYTYMDSSNRIVVASLRRNGDLYTCESACSVYVSSAPDFVPDIYVIVNENSNDGSVNRVFNSRTGVEVFKTQNQLLIPKDRNIIAKSVDGSEELMYLAGDKVAYSSSESFEVYDQIKNIIRIPNTDERTRSQHPHAFIDTGSGERTLIAPVVGSVLTAFDSSFDVQTCGRNGIGIGRNGGSVKCDWLSIATPSMNVMEYLKGKRRLMIVGRTLAGEEFYDVRADQRHDQFDHIAISPNNDDLFVLARSDGKWYVYSLVTSKFVSIPNVMMNNFSNTPSGVEVFPSYFIVETRNSITYYNHNMESFYEIAK